MPDIYTPPEASLVDASGSEDQFGSIEKGMRGDYDFTISDVLSEAWQRTKGAKGTLWLAFLIYMGIAIGLSVVFEVAMYFIRPALADPTLLIIINVIQQLLFNLVLMPVAIGFMLLGVRRAADAPLRASSILNYFSSMFNLLLTLILVYLMVFIGLLLLVVPGIYLMVAYYMALPLVVEKGLSPWQAMEVSRKTISKRWFTTFFFFIVLTLIVIVSMLPLGIGLIWSLPMLIIAYGIVYRNMFGIRNETLS